MAKPYQFTPARRAALLKAARESARKRRGTGKAKRKSNRNYRREKRSLRNDFVAGTPGAAGRGRRQTRRKLRKAYKTQKAGAATRHDRRTARRQFSANKGRLRTYKRKKRALKRSRRR